MKEEEKTLEERKEEVKEALEGVLAEEEQTEEQAEEEQTESVDETMKKPLSKKEKKDKKDQKIEDLSDKLMRSMAEFDNYRKRSEKEKTQMFEIGAKDIVERILPVLDNFERGLGTITEEEKEGAFAKGIEQIYKQFVSVLEKAGVKPIEAIGKEFDPDFHNAVMHAEDGEQGENLVVDEFQKGYMYRENVVRHSMVKVVN